MKAVPKFWTGLGALTLVLSSCGAGESPQTEALSRALKAWSDFPVTASPRLLVMVGPKVLPPASGAPYGAGASITYPSGVWPVAPSSADGFSIISSVTAFSTLTSLAAQAAKGLPPTVGLIVTSIHFGSGVFQTDRGPWSLPAWLFTFQGVPDPAMVLAVSPSNIFLPSHALYGKHTPSIQEATINPADRTLTVRFVGGPSGTGPCSDQYTLGTAESEEAVALLVNEKKSMSNAGSSRVACTAKGVPRQLTLTLSERLGARVVVDAGNGSAIAVLGPNAIAANGSR